MYSSVIILMTPKSAGRFEEAGTEWKRAVELQPTDLYRHLLYAVCLHHTRGGRAAKEHIAELTKDLEDDTWIVPVLRFYAGEIEEEEVWAAVQDSVPEKLTEKQCEAFYYLGVAHLLGMDAIERVEPDTTKATDYFEKCLATKKVGFVEYGLAAAALERLSTAAN